ncbi:MAG: GNAT family N-acetyltransferase [Sulfuriferula sp.]
MLSEIMVASKAPAFNFDLDATTARLKDFLEREKYFVFIALDADKRVIGFVSLYESYALYAEGVFGTLAEFYVCLEWRSKNVGLRLISEVKSFAITRGWKRLEVTTPPLPQFDKTLVFYEREGFAIAGGRKLKLVL